MRIHDKDKTGQAGKEGARYLELNSEHLTLFLKPLDGAAGIDRACVADLFRTPVQPSKKMRAECCCERTPSR